MGLSMDSPLCVAFLSILFIIFDLPPGSDLFKEFERNTRSRDTSGTLTNTELRLKTNISHCYLKTISLEAVLDSFELA